MNTTITKTITTLTTWRNERTGEKVQFESDTELFYLFNSDGRLTASIELKEADWALKLCDLAVSNDKHTLELAGKDFVPNTAFLSAVLTQFLHKLNTTHNDDTHN